MPTDIFYYNNFIDRSTLTSSLIPRTTTITIGNDLPIKTNSNDDGVQLIYSLVGFKKEEIIVKYKLESNNLAYINVIASSENHPLNAEEFNKKYSLNLAEFDFDKITTNFENGLLFINIPYNEFFKIKTIS